MNILLLILQACGNAYLVSSISAYEREITDGGTQNRIWSFVVQTSSLVLSISPIMLLFPGALWVSALYYSVLGLSGLTCYLASICHSNQIKRNFGQEEVAPPIRWGEYTWNLDGLIKLGTRLFVSHNKIEPLPWNLNNNQYVTKEILFISRHFNKISNAIYFTGLLFLAGTFPIYSIAALGMLTVNKAYQKGYFPEWLQTIYFIGVSFLCIGYFTGYNSWFNIASTLFSIAFMTYDYFQVHIRGKQSSTSQFPIATPENELSIEKVLGKKCTNHTEMSRSIKHFLSQERKLVVTFNHFHDAHVLGEKVIVGELNVDYRGYKKHFCELDFSAPRVRDVILNEMAVHDKFHEKQLSERKMEFGLSEEAEIVDVYIAFLKQEMDYLVERLTNVSYRDLNNQQINTLHGQARLILNNLNNANDVDLKIKTMLSLAIRTGSHCNRIYLEVFSELSQDVYHSIDLTTKESALFAAQDAREDAFRNYYYKTVREFFLDKISDINDYHSYEIFVLNYGQFFYLRNSSLSQRVRSFGDWWFEKLITFILKARGLSFSDFYTERYLIQQVLNGKLHSVFQKWCNEKIYPGCYEEIVINDYSMVRRKNPTVIGLAKLMLLDCGIVELASPYKPPAVPQEALALQAPRVTPLFQSVNRASCHSGIDPDLRSCQHVT